MIIIREAQVAGSRRIWASLEGYKRQNGEAHENVHVGLLATE